MDEVDELLLEQELLSPVSKDQVLIKKQSKGQLSPQVQVDKALQESLGNSAIEKLMNGGEIEDIYSPLKKYNTHNVPKP